MAAPVLLLLAAGCEDLVGKAVVVSEGTADDADDTEAEAKGSEPAPEDGLKEVLIKSSSDGWISSEQNELVIQGLWTEYSSWDSSIEKTIAEDGLTVCATGEVKAPPISDEGEQDFITYFGAKLGFSLCTDDDGVSHTLEACPLSDLLAESLVGIAFSLEVVDGNLPAGRLRLQFTEDGRLDGAYVAVAEGDDQTALFEEASIEYAPGLPPVDVKKVNRIDFYLSTGDMPEGEEAVAFEFCVSDIFLLARLPV